MYSATRFEFFDVRPSHADVRLDESISSRDDLFDAYVGALKFPDYFGRNWDAFIDCMSDLSWLDRDEILAVHDGLPALPETALRTYLECLQTVLDRLRPHDRPKPRFCFRESDRKRVAALLSVADR